MLQVVAGDEPECKKGHWQSTLSEAVLSSKPLTTFEKVGRFESDPGGSGMPNFSETERLPTSYAAAIGRVIARWSYQEWLLSQIAYRLLGVGPKQGRAAVRSPRAEDYVTIFQHLIKLRHLTVSVDLLGFKKALKAAENERDLLAHSLWLLEPGTRKVAGIWLTKGNWKSGQFHPQGTPKILQPQFVQKKPQDLRASYKSIDATIKITRKLEGELKALLPPWP